MLPMAMWSIAMVGYITYVIMALVASPFWAAMHAHPDGDDFMGRAGSGYPILMTLLLHPLLMIVGLIAGMAILRVAGWFMGAFLFDSMQDMNAGGINITSLFGQLTMWAIVMITVTYKCMSLTYELPEHVLKWMGVGSQFSDLGERQGLEKGLVMGGMVGSRSQETMTSGMNTMQKRVQGRREAEQEADKEKKAGDTTKNNNPSDGGGDSPGGGDPQKKEW